MQNKHCLTSVQKSVRTQKIAQIDGHYELAPTHLYSLPVVYAGVLPSIGETQVDLMCILSF